MTTNQRDSEILHTDKTSWSSFLTYERCWAQNLHPGYRPQRFRTGTEKKLGLFRAQTPDLGAVKRVNGSESKTGMKQTTVSEQIIRLDRLAKEAAATGDALNLTVVYEDADTRKWAREVYDRTTKFTGPQGVRATWWRISDLSAPGVLAGAVSTAMRADAIVIATRATHGLPLPFYVWVKAWLRNRLSPSGTLVALMGTPQEPESRPGGVREFLQATANAARLEFVKQEKHLTNGEVHLKLPARPPFPFADSLPPFEPFALRSNGNGHEFRNSKNRNGKPSIMRSRIELKKRSKTARAIN